MNQKSSFALSLAVVVLVVLAPLAALRHSKRGQMAASPSHGRSAHTTGRRETQPSPSKDFIFDPVLVFSSFLGGPTYNVGGVLGTTQFADAIYVDSSGNFYLAGGTNSPTFPTTPSTLQPTPGKNGSFLAKVDPTGQHLVFSTYVPGFPGPITAMAVDGSGSIYVAGLSNPALLGAPPLPIPSGSSPYAHSGSIGILKLNPTATSVLAGTYLGGSQSTVAGLALDSSNNVYITGSTSANDFPVSSSPLQASLGTSGQNAFVTVLDSSLSTAIYSTYLGANSSASTATGSHAIAVDAAKNAYVIGSANTGFPPAGSPVQASCSGTCVFVAKLNPTGSAITYSTYLGTDARGGAIAVDGSQNIFISGAAFNSGFNELNPVSTFPSCNANLNSDKVFVSKIAASGALAFSTCLPGSSTGNLALDSSGIVYVAGSGFSALPLTHPIQSHAGGSDPYIAAIDPSTSSVAFSSFIGGAQTEESESINDIAVDSTGNIYATGFAQQIGGATPFPVFNALQPASGGFTPCPNNPCGLGSDAVFLKIAPTDAPAAAVSPAVLTFPAQPLGVASSPSPVTIFDLGSADLTVSNVAATGDFSVQQSCGTVTAAGGTCPVQVTFTPTAAGTRSGALTITDDSTGSPRTVALTGTGGQQSVSLTPATLSFSQAVNTTGTSQVTFTNTGTLPVAISSVQTSGATFSETNGCGVSVDVGKSCVINVSFSPTATGNSTGALTITDSATGSPHAVQLTGTGVADSLGLTFPPNASSTATVSSGGFALTAIQLGGAGVAGNVTLSCSNLPQGSACTFDPSSTVQVSATGTRQVNVTITTTSRSFLFLPIILATGLFLLAMSLSVLFYRHAAITLAPRLRWRFVPLFALAICACGGGASSPTGGNGSSTGTPAGSHVIVITATSGSSTQTLNFNLIVQ
jgi:hypothetical protein